MDDKTITSHNEKTSFWDERANYKLHIHQENKAILKWLSKKNTNHEEIDRS
jgi:hypothetical protein